MLNCTNQEPLATSSDLLIEQAYRLVNEGTSILGQGLVNQAISCYQRAIDLHEGFAEAHYNLGVALGQARQVDAAIKSYQRAIELKPDLTQALFNLANLWMEQGNLDQAAGQYRRVLGLDAGHWKAYTQLGVTLRKLGRPEDALENLEQAIRLKADHYPALANLGMTLIELCRVDEALDVFQRALQVRPEHGPAHGNLGAALNLAGRYEEAIAEYEQAIHMDADDAHARWNRALLLLLFGRYEEGWKDYHWRRQAGVMHMAYPHTYSQPRWDGTQFEGRRLLVHYEQGLGDTIQFIRYLPWVKARGGTVLFETPASLYRLLEDWNCIDQLIPRTPGLKPEAAFDLVVSLMDLPALFHTTLDTLPAEVPYLFASPSLVKAWAERIDSRSINIGVVWAGKPVDQGRVATLRQRTCRLEDLRPLADVPGVRLYGLQKGPAAREVQELSMPLLAANLGDLFDDFADTAAAIQAMDLIVSIDTSVAHLAGAMAKPTWVLLKHDADWRWLLDRTDSPWYPTMRLFRQAKGEDWPIVVDRVAEHLRKTVLSSRLHGGSKVDK